MARVDDFDELTNMLDELVNSFPELPVQPKSPTLGRTTSKSRVTALPKIEMDEDFLKPPESPKFADKMIKGEPDLLDELPSFDEVMGNSLPSFDSFIESEARKRRDSSAAAIAVETYTHVAVAAPKGVDQLNPPIKETPRYVPPRIEEPKPQPVTAQKQPPRPIDNIPELKEELKKPPPSIDELPPPVNNTKSPKSRGLDAIPSPPIREDPSDLGEGMVTSGKVYSYTPPPASPSSQGDKKKEKREKKEKKDKKERRSADTKVKESKSPEIKHQEIKSPEIKHEIKQPIVEPKPIEIKQEIKHYDIKPLEPKPPMKISIPAAKPQDPITPEIKSPKNQAAPQAYRPPIPQPIDNIPPPIKASPRLERARAASIDEGTSVVTNGYKPPQVSEEQPPEPTEPDAETWKEYTSRTTGKKYYYNTLTRKTTWQKPPEFDLQPTVKPDINKTTPARSTRSQSVVSAMTVLSAPNNLETFDADLDPQRVNRVLRTPTEGLSPVIVTVKLVDDSTKKLSVTEDFTIQDVIYTFADKLDLWQTEYFSISSVSADGIDRWLQHNRTLKEQNIFSQNTLTFKIKHLKQPRKLIDSAAIHLFYLQIQRNIISGNYPCPERLALRLAAYQMQILYGAFAPEKHHAGYFDSQTIKTILPSSVVDPAPLDYLERRVLTIYATLGGMKKNEAEMKYIELSKKIPLFGVTVFDVTESNQIRKLGIAEDGFLISKKDSRTTFDFYGFEEIGGWNQVGSGIQIRISNPDKKPLFDISTNCGYLISELLCDYYCLLRPLVPSLPVIKLPMNPHQLPDYRLYSPPPVRKTSDPNFSRLELFKSTYQEEAKTTKVPLCLELLEQIDEHLDAEDKSLEKLELAGCSIDPPQMDLLATTITKIFKYEPKAFQIFIENMNLKTIDLCDNPIGHEGAVGLSKLIQAPFPLKVLKLKNVKLGLKGAQAIADSVQHNKTIEELYVDENELGDKGAAVIIEAVKHIENFSSLGLSKNQLGEKIIPEIGKIVKNNSNFSGLYLAGNRLGDSGVVNLLMELRKALKKSLEILDLSDVGINSSGKKLMVWLSQNSQMKQMILASNHVGEKASQELVKVLLDSVSRLVKLDIKLCDIGSKSMTEICSTVGVNRKLEFLSVSGNVVKKKAGAALAASIESNKSLLTLSIRNCQLAKPTLLLLLRAIRKHPTIKVLDLAMNDMSSMEVARELEDMLTFHRTLEDLNIAACQFTAQALTVICTGLGKNSTLKTIHLDANKIGKHIVKVAEAATSHRKLEVLTLKNVEVSKKDITDFFNTLATSCSLKHINLERNELERGPFDSRLKQYTNLRVKF